jgi:hypothetical protein
MVDRLVAVTQEVAEIGDPAPGRGGVLGLQLVRDEARGLGDDLQAALDRKPQEAVTKVIVDGSCRGSGF